MEPRIAPPLQPNIALRQTEESPPDRSSPATNWFYIVDVEATGPEHSAAPRNSKEVLGLSATEADADAAAALDGLGVIYYAELSETRRRSLASRIDAADVDHRMCRGGGGGGQRA